MKIQSKVKPAFFLDRDGVIIQEIGYLSRADQIQLLPGTYEAIRMVNRRGLPVVVVTNQAGIARGYFSEEQLEEVHLALDKKLAEHGAHIDRYYYCPHHPEGELKIYRKNCSCRKPEPGLLIKASEELDISLSESLLVGDKESDILAGIRAGCPTALVMSGYGRMIVDHIRGIEAYQSVYIIEDILGAAELFLSMIG